MNLTESCPSKGFLEEIALGDKAALVLSNVLYYCSNVMYYVVLVYVISWYTKNKIILYNKVIRS